MQHTTFQLHFFIVGEGLIDIRDWLASLLQGPALEILVPIALSYTNFGCR